MILCAVVLFFLPDASPEPVSAEPPPPSIQAQRQEREAHPVRAQPVLVPDGPPENPKPPATTEQAPPLREVARSPDQPPPPAPVDEPLEAPLVAGNIDLAMRDYERVKLKASGDPRLAEFEREYAIAKKKQTELLESAGYRQEVVRSDGGVGLNADH